MTFTEAISTCFQKYATFEGRATRSEFWYFALFNFIAVMVISMVSLSSPKLYLVLAVLWVLGVILPSIAVSVRRLHDVGRTGWWYLLCLIPFGSLVLLVFSVLESDEDNEYGPKPVN